MQLLLLLSDNDNDYIHTVVAKSWPGLFSGDHSKLVRVKVPDRAGQDFFYRPADALPATRQPDVSRHRMTLQRQ